MRTRHTINPVITDDAAGKDVLFALDEDLAEVVADNFKRFAAGRFEIAASSNEDLSFGDVQDVRFIFVKADNDFNIKLNGGAQVLQLKRAGQTAKSTARFGGEFNVTAINVANPSATVALSGVFVVYGDPS